MHGREVKESFEWRAECKKFVALAKIFLHAAVHIEVGPDNCRSDQGSRADLCACISNSYRTASKGMESPLKALFPVKVSFTVGVACFACQHHRGHSRKCFPRPSQAELGTCLPFRAFFTERG